MHSSKQFIQIYIHILAGCLAIQYDMLSKAERTFNMIIHSPDIENIVFTYQTVITILQNQQFTCLNVEVYFVLLVSAIELS